MALRVLIVHEHLAYGEAIQVLIDTQGEFRCVGVATTVAAAERLLERQDPDVVLVDLELGRRSGGALSAQELGRWVVAMASTVSVETFERAMDVGATGFVGKDAPVSELINALRHAGPRMTVGGTTLELLLADARGWLDLTTRRIDPSTRGTVHRRRVDVNLTRREREVLRLMREGLDAQSMARHLHVSVHTARSHIKKVLAKLGAHSQLEAVAIANRLGMDSGEGDGV